VPGVDGLLAATGIPHGLCFMTRNAVNFEANGALVRDPWQDSGLSLSTKRTKFSEISRSQPPSFRWTQPHELI
jgi:hypothetical protein